MPLRFVFAILLLHVTYIESYPACPTLEQMEPCNCTVGTQGLKLFCNGGLVDEIRDTLANVSNTTQGIYRLELEDIWLPNLPSNLLLGHDVYEFFIHNCSTSTVDEDAFVHMAATLKRLSLMDNALELVPSHALEKCLNLTELYLSNNRIEILHAKAFLGLDSLQQLSLRGNRIKFIDNSAFVGIGRHFKTLHLGGNELTAVPCLQLRNQRSLQHLFLQNNRIASLLPKELGVMHGGSLKYLNLENNTIQHLPARVFRVMKRLEYLILSENAIESIPSSAFEGIEGTLQYLKLDYNRLEEVPSAAIKNMRVLDYVDLNGNKIRKIRRNDFKTYGKNLISIYLQNNSLEYIDPNAFIGLHSLITLYLGSNQLKTFTFETFAPISDTILWFNLHDNPLHCDCNLSWIKRATSRHNFTERTECATPEKYANVSLIDIAVDKLICDKSNSTEPCYNCSSNTQKLVSSNVLMSILLICLMYLLTIPF